MAKIRRKKSLSYALWNVTKHVFKGGWWVVKGLAVAAYTATRFVTLKVSDKIDEHKNNTVKKRERKVVVEENPKIESSAEFQELQVKKAIQGEYSHFESKLLDDSLIIAITGKRGSGKSTLGFRLLENINAKAKRPCFVIGVKQSILPSWITAIDSVDGVSNSGVVLVDEGAVTFSSRDSMSKKNKELGKLLAIARHKDLTLILITQNTGMLDKNVLNLTDTILLKQGSLLQTEMERSFMKKLYRRVDPHFASLSGNERKAHTYVVDAEFEGLISTPLPGFWSTRISKNQA